MVVELHKSFTNYGPNKRRSCNWVVSHLRITDFYGETNSPVVPDAVYSQINSSYPVCYKGNAIEISESSPYNTLEKLRLHIPDTPFNLLQGDLQLPQNFVDMLMCCCHVTVI